MAGGVLRTSMTKPSIQPRGRDSWQLIGSTTGMTVLQLFCSLAVPWLMHTPTPTGQQPVWIHFCLKSLSCDRILPTTLRRGCGRNFRVSLTKVYACTIINPWWCRSPSADPTVNGRFTRAYRYDSDTAVLRGRLGCQVWPLLLALQHVK